MTLEELMVKVQGDVKPFKDAMAKAKKEAFDAADKIDRALDNMGKGAGKGAMKSIDQTLKKTRSLRDELKILNQKAKIEAGVLKPNQQFRDLQATIRATTRELDSLQKKQASMSPVTSKYTDEFKGIKTEYDTLGKAFDELLDKEESMKGFDRSNSGIKQLWDELQDEIAQTAARLGEYETRMAEMEASGQAYTANEKWYELQSAIEGATADLERYKATEEQMLLSGNGMADKGGPSRSDAFMAGVASSDVVPQRLKTLMGLLKAVGDTAKGTKSGLSSFAATAKAAFQRPIGWLKQLASGFGKVVSKIPLLGRNAKGATSGIGSLFKGLRGVWNIAKLLVIGQGLMGWVNATKEGFGNLSVYSASTRASLESLKASLLTLKNAFATALAPILDVVAPILSKVIDWFIGAATAVAHLMAALTGKSVVTVARKATAGVASGVGSVGSAADDAKGSVDDLKKSLMGFDQINKLDDNSSGSGGGSGGGGGGGGAAGAGSMFETVEVGANAMKIADMIKAAWAEADFTEIGNMVAEKLNTALKSIPWSDIQTTCNKIAKSVATFLNGFFEHGELWETVGVTIGEGLNTAVYAAQTFATEFHWDSFGTALGRTVKTAISTIDWAAIGNTIGEYVKGAFTSAAKFVETVDWGDLGKGLITAAKKVDWGGVAGSIAEFLGAALGGIVDLVGNVLLEIGKGIADGFKDGILAGIANIAKWIVDHIFTPFIDGFATAFGIHSPSTVMKEKGHDIIAGLLEGLEDKIDDIKTWFTNLPGKIKEWIGSAGEKIGATVELAAELVGDKWRYINEKVSNVAQYTAEKVGNVWSSITGMVGKTLSYAAEKAGNVWSSITGISGKTLSYYADKAGKTWSAITGISGKTLNYYADKAGKTWASISGMAGKTLNYYAKKAGKTWKSITGMTGKTLKFTASLVGKGWNALKALFGGGGATGGVYLNGTWRPVQAYASGGLIGNHGQMFVAREAGPELVGTIGGHTAIMNNEQIVSSVAAGVARAVSQVMGNGNTSEVHVYLEGDAKQIFRIVKAEAQNYTNSTGAAPFPV